MAAVTNEKARTKNYSSLLRGWCKPAVDLDHLAFPVRRDARQQRPNEPSRNRTARLVVQVHGQSAAVVQVQQQPNPRAFGDLWCWVQGHAGAFAAVAEQVPVRGIALEHHPRVVSVIEVLAIVEVNPWPAHSKAPVSYTHLTLPTILRV